MIPRITTTYLALAPSGRVVSSFGCPDLARAFAANQAARGCRLELAVETVTRRPLGKYEAMLADEPVVVARMQGRK